MHNVRNVHEGTQKRWDKRMAHIPSFRHFGPRGILWSVYLEHPAGDMPQSGPIVYPLQLCDNALCVNPTQHAVLFSTPYLHYSFVPCYPDGFPVAVLLPPYVQTSRKFCVAGSVYSPGDLSAPLCPQRADVSLRTFAL